jgi:hypothetical protein
LDHKEIVELYKYDVVAFSLRVKIQEQLTEVFGVEKGLAQGDVSSAALFHVVLEKVIRNT